MILIWSRWGILVALLAALGVFAGLGVQLVFNAAGITHEGDQSTTLFVGLGFAIGGGFIWLFEHFLLVPHLDRPRTYVRTFKLDQPQIAVGGTVQTHIQAPVQYTPRSTFFFVPFKYWWIVSTALGGVLFVIGLVLLFV